MTKDEFKAMLLYLLRTDKEFAQQVAARLKATGPLEEYKPQPFDPRNASPTGGAYGR